VKRMGKKRNTLDDFEWENLKEMDPLGEKMGVEAR